MQIVVCTTYTEMNQVSTISSMVNDKLHGRQVEYYDNGKIKWKGAYFENSIIDTAFGFFSSGKVESITTSKFYVRFTENGDTLSYGKKRNGKNIGLCRIYFSRNHPERFTNFDSLGRQNGWEVFWYRNGNVKDSSLFRNDSTKKQIKFYHNGKIAKVLDCSSGPASYNATTYTYKGKKSGEVKNGTGEIVHCDSVGENCDTMRYKDGKYFTKPSVARIPEDTVFKKALMERLLENDVVFVKKLGRKQLSMLFDDRITPLHVASDIGTLEMVKVLIEKGAEINAMNSYAQTPLDIAAIKGRSSIVAFLLKKGADPNVVENNYHSQTALYFAIEGKDTATVRLLLENGANPHVTNYDGATPLHYAACKGDSLVLKLILNVDKDIERVDDDGWNALKHARSCENAETEKILTRMSR